MLLQALTQLDVQPTVMAIMANVVIVNYRRSCELSQ